MYISKRVAYGIPEYEHGPLCDAFSHLASRNDGQRELRAWYLHGRVSFSNDGEHGQPTRLF